MAVKEEEYMGGSGNTLVEGVRRWFQRRSNHNTNNNHNHFTSSNNSDPTKKKKQHNNNNNNDSGSHVSSVTELRAQSSTIPKQLKQEEEEHGLEGLKLIKVPQTKRANHFKPGSMDSIKKVLFFLLRSRVSFRFFTFLFFIC